MRHVTSTVGTSYPARAGSLPSSATSSTPSIAPPLLAALFRGLGDPARLSCLFALRTQARTVGEVVAMTGLSQPNVSKHLACLRECGLVQAEKSGRFVTYCLRGTGVEELLKAAEAVLVRAGDDLAACPIYRTNGVVTTVATARIAAGGVENKRQEQSEGES